LIANLRAAPAIFLQPKTVAKHTEYIAVCADPPDEIKTRIGFEGFQKDVQTPVKGLIAGRGETRLFERLLKKGFFIEADKRGTV
jgi:hypothetical protein